jgi:hypothetical protein
MRIVAVDVLGAFLGSRFTHSGDPRELDRGISRLEELGAELIGQPAVVRAIVRSTSTLRLTRDEVEGGTGDVEAVIRALEAIAGEQEPTPVAQQQTHGVLAMALYRRFAEQGDLDDFERALALAEEAAQATVEFRTLLSSLLSLRYEFTRDQRDLERALALAEAEVEQERAFPGSPELPGLLVNLGDLLHARYVHGGDLDGLRHAVDALDEAVELERPTTPNYARALCKLGLAVFERHLSPARGDGDLDRSLRLLEDAVRRTPPEAPYFVSRLLDLARARAHATDPAARARAIEEYRDGCRHGLEVAPERVLLGAADWGDWAVARESWPEAAEAYGYALQAMLRLFVAQLARSHRERWLRDAEGNASRLAHALAKVGDPMQAARALERGRALLLSDALERDRADLDQLASLGHAELLDRYRRSAEKIARLERAALDRQ